jgi:lambda family phage portal protein
MLAWLGKLFSRGGGPPASGQASRLEPDRPGLRAYYDNAQTTDETSRLKGLVDNLSAKASNNFAVRRQLRSWSRYEIANGGFARGMIDTWVQDLVGTGPKVRVTLRDPESGQPQMDESPGRQIGRRFHRWFNAVGGLEKVRTIATAKKTDGEGFFVFTNYDRVADPVKLFPRDIECDQVTTPSNGIGQTLWVDGMVIDTLGQPVSYDLLRTHPGDYFYSNLNPWEFDRIPAKQVVHWFRKSRPGQLRGVPELTPSLELFGRLRSYSKAVLGAAEIAADFAAVLETEAAANDDPSSPGNSGGLLPFDQTPIDRQVMTALPAGASLKQFVPQQPAQTYEMFQYCTLAEACRPVNVPLNVALGTSQQFNFSSARLDHLNYRAGLRVERRECEIVVLGRLFWAWFEEASLIPGLLPEGVSADMIELHWYWPGWPDQDPMNDAQADTERLDNGTTTEAELAAEQGHDWEERIQQQVRERAYRQRLETAAGLAPRAPSARPAAPAAPRTPKQAKAVAANLS